MRVGRSGELGDAYSQEFPIDRRFHHRKRVAQALLLRPGQAQIVDLIRRQLCTPDIYDVATGFPSWPRGAYPLPAFTALLSAENGNPLCQNCADLVSPAQRFLRTRRRYLPSAELK